MAKSLQLANAFGSSAIKDLKLCYAQTGTSSQSFMSGIPISATQEMPGTFTTGLVFVPKLAAGILGASRETPLGDLENVKVTFQVIEGDGAAAILTTSTDNASGDPFVRYE